MKIDVHFKFVKFIALLFGIERDKSIKYSYTQILAVLFCFCLPCFSRPELRVVVFPYVNNGAGELNSWQAYAIPQYFFYKLRLLPEIHVWDPVALFQIDSSAYRMNNDSLIIKNRARWGWDIAIGGSYGLDSNKLKIQTVMLYAAEHKDNIRIDFETIVSRYQYDSACTSILYKVLKIAQFDLNSRDSLLIQKGIRTNRNAFETFAAGLGFEMHGEYDNAITTYSRAVEVDNAFAYGWCRLSSIFAKNGNIVMASNGFQIAGSSSSRDEYVIADIANFMIENKTQGEAFRYIDFNREQLLKTPEGLMAIGKKNMAEGEYQRARAILTKAVTEGSPSLEVQMALGAANLYAAEYKMASDVFNELIRFRPDYLRYYSSLGASYRNSGQLMESSQILAEALKLDPFNTTIMIDLATTYFKLNLLPQARQLLNRVIELDPSHEIAIANLGVIYWFENRKNDALNCFKKASEHSKSKQTALNNIGNTLFESEKYHKAIRMYRSADRVGKKNVNVLFNLAKSYLKIGNLKKAGYYYNEFLRLSPARIDILSQAAFLAEKIGKYSDAESYYYKILEIYPYHRNALKKLVKILAKDKRYNESIKPVEDFLDHFPHDKEIMVLLGDIYFEMGWYEVAIMKYNFVVRDFPDAAEGYAGVAKAMYYQILYKNSVAYDQTIYALKNASDHDKSSTEHDLLAGTVYLKYKKYDDMAEEHFSKALLRSKNEKERKHVQKRIHEIKKTINTPNG